MSVHKEGNYSLHLKTTYTDKNLKTASSRLILGSVIKINIKIIFWLRKTNF